MAGVYGDMLAAFPELMAEYVIFTMQPKAEGGFTERKPYKTVRAYLTRNIGGDAGMPDGTFTEFDKAQFYVFNPVPRTVIAQGAYVQDEASGTLYKFTQDNTFAKEGGFAVHRLLSVEGATDRQVGVPEVPDRTINDY